MIIRLTAHVGVFSAQVECDSTAEADKFITWVYALEGREERQAIINESKAPAKDDEPPFDVAPGATVDDAVKAVKEYAAIHKPDKARELMQQFGIGRTSEITAEIAPKIVEAIKAAA